MPVVAEAAGRAIRMTAMSRAEDPVDLSIDLALDPQAEPSRTFPAVMAYELWRISYGILVMAY